MRADTAGPVEIYCGGEREALRVSQATKPRREGGDPLERLSKEVKRRTDVEGIFPNPASLLRLATCVLIESYDEWQVAERRYLSEESIAQLTPTAITASPTQQEVVDTDVLRTA